MQANQLGPIEYLIWNITIPLCSANVPMTKTIYTCRDGEKSRWGGGGLHLDGVVVRFGSAASPCRIL